MSANLNEPYGFLLFRFICQPGILVHIILAVFSLVQHCLLWIHKKKEPLPRNIFFSTTKAKKKQEHLRHHTISEDWFNKPTTRIVTEFSCIWPFVGDTVKQLCAGNRVFSLSDGSSTQEKIFIFFPDP